MANSLVEIIATEAWRSRYTGDVSRPCFQSFDLGLERLSMETTLKTTPCGPISVTYIRLMLSVEC